MSNGEIGNGNHTAKNGKEERGGEQEERKGKQQTGLLSPEFISSGLGGSKDVLRFVDTVQKEHGPDLGACEPALGLLEVLGFRRVQLFRDLFLNLKQRVVDGVKRSNKANLRKLLNETLPFLAHPGLEEVPIKVLAALPSTPDKVLETLSLVDASTINKLPRHTRQQLWEEYPDRFFEAVGPLIEAYLSDQAAITWAEEMYPDSNYPPPHKRRQRNTPLQQMIQAIGSSPKLYRIVVDHIREEYVATENPRYCALRADLLMAFHDISSQTILATEPCHDFSWHLDAYVKQVFNAVAHGALDVKTAQLLRTVANELRKLMAGSFKPGLVSAYATTKQAASHNAAAMLASAPGGAAAAAAATVATATTPAGPSGKMRLPASLAVRASLGPKPSKIKPLDKYALMLTVWRRVKKYDYKNLFLHPVLDSHPQLEKAYLAKISQPMDLQTIEHKIRRKKYADLDELRADLHLIADNAVKFNGPDHDIAKRAVNHIKATAENFLNHARERLAENAARLQGKVGRDAGLGLKEVSALGVGAPVPPAGALGRTAPIPGGLGAGAVRSSPSAATPQAPAVVVRTPQQLAKEAEEKLKLQKLRKENERIKEEEAEMLRKKEEMERELGTFEELTLHDRALSDAAMILASGFTVNALSNVLWYLIGEDIIKKETLPRDSYFAKNTGWLLQVAGDAHHFVKAAQEAALAASSVPARDAVPRASVSIPELSKSFETEALPLFANMLLDAAEYRISKPSPDGVVEVDAMDPILKPLCKNSWVVRNSLLHFFCQRVGRRDRSLIDPVLEVIRDLGADATDQPAFLHSLVTSFFISAQSNASRAGNVPGPGGGLSRHLQRRSPTHVLQSRMSLPPLPPNVLEDTISQLFLPAVLRTSPTQTPEAKVARQHTHLTRLLSLESTLHSLPEGELFKVARAAILSLAGAPKDFDPAQILASPELKDVINKRFNAPSFDRARKQYEKLFRKLPSLRSQCGIKRPLDHLNDKMTLVHLLVCIQQQLFVPTVLERGGSIIVAATGPLDLCGLSASMRDISWLATREESVHTWSPSTSMLNTMRLGMCSSLTSADAVSPSSAGIKESKGAAHSPAQEALAVRGGFAIERADGGELRTMLTRAGALLKPIKGNSGPKLPSPMPSTEKADHVALLERRAERLPLERAAVAQVAAKLQSLALPPRPEAGLVAESHPDAAVRGVAVFHRHLEELRAGCLAREPRRPIPPQCIRPRRLPLLARVRQRPRRVPLRAQHLVPALLRLQHPVARHRRVPVLPPAGKLMRGGGCRAGRSGTRANLMLDGARESPLLGDAREAGRGGAEGEACRAAREAGAARGGSPGSCGTGEDDLDGSQGAAVPRKQGHKQIGLFSLTSATVICLGLLGMIEYSMILPSLNIYVEEMGQSKVFYGLCMAIFSAARLLFMPVLGYWSDKRPMIEAFSFSLVIEIVGNVLYGCAYGMKNPWMILLARALIGMGSANSTLSMSFITRITEQEERTKALAMLSGINLVGIVIGPATNLLVKDIDFRIGDTVLVFNHLTNPGWLMVFLLLGIFALMLLTFEEPPAAGDIGGEGESAPSAILVTSATGGGNSPSPVLFQTLERRYSDFSIMSEELQEPMIRTEDMVHTGSLLGDIRLLFFERRMLVHFVLSFCINFVTNELETALPSVTRTAYGWGSVENSTLYAIMGLSVAFVLIGIVKSNGVADRTFIVFGHLGNILGLVVAVGFLRSQHPSMAVLLLCTLILICVSPITGSPNMSLFSKRLQEDPRTANSMGFYIGLLQGTNGLSRVLAPIFAGVALEQSTRLLLYSGPLVLVLVSFFFVLRNFDSLRPPGKPST
ncbi:Negative elongation factor B (NELF-B) (Cofactor of BRCA1) [Durusdinium trenchii]|uniref:Negative elongation factor B (NELF-B) (Cofactor of BRCA1) n=1 Tax=Durusdinium trenchii TaxID=1381693 RepID=A0ABP0HWW5_9DINO